MASCNRSGEPREVMCRLKNAKDVVIKRFTLHEAIAEYLKEKGTISPKLDGRAIATDIGKSTFTKMPEGNYKFM